MVILLREFSSYPARTNQSNTSHNHFRRINKISLQIVQLNILGTSRNKEEIRSTIINEFKGKVSLYCPKLALKMTQTSLRITDIFMIDLHFFMYLPRLQIRISNLCRENLQSLIKPINKICRRRFLSRDNGNKLH